MRRRGCRACCRATHLEEAPCDPCPLSKVEREAWEAYRLYRFCVHDHTDPKTRITRPSVSLENLAFAFDHAEIFDIADQVQAFADLQLAIGVFSGDDDEPIPDDEDDE